MAKTHQRLEYEQLNEWWRHNENVGWAVGAILVPASLGSLALLFSTTDRPSRYALAGAAFALFLCWCLIQQRLALITSLRMKRAAELEDALGMNHHKAVRAGLDTTRLPPIQRIWWAMLIGVALVSVSALVAPPAVPPPQTTTPTPP